MWINKSANGKYLILTFRYSPKTVLLVRSLTGRKFDPQHKRWLVPIDQVIEVVDTLKGSGFNVHLDVIREYEERKKFFELIEQIKKDSTKYEGNLPLFEFQKSGTSYLDLMDGALLADAPGLGKSIQTIAALKDDLNLILCPASLKYSWKEEIEKWDPSTFSIVNGKKSDRDIAWAIALKGHAHGGRRIFPKYVVANYELLLRDYAKIKEIPWNTIVCDEATRISNPFAKSVKLLKTLQAKKRIALTGTPISNTAIDLWSIIDFVEPGFLGSFHHFKDKYTIMDPWGGVSSYKNLDELAEKVKPFILRRTKEEVAKDLPPKIVKNISFNLSLQELKLYEYLVKQISEEVKKMSFDPRTLPIIPVKMLRLKQLTDHPKLIGSEVPSSKFEALCELLDPIIKSEEKVLVFTQFATMADLLHNLLLEKGILSLVLKGEVPTAERQRLIEKFRTDDAQKVFVMTEAGAYGLNLQVASYVIHYDSPWSIAKLMQREDRAHRIGQDKPVTVYNLKARGTIDEYVQKVLNKKNKMSVGILGDVERMEDAGLSMEDIKEILRIE